MRIFVDITKELIVFYILLIFSIIFIAADAFTGLKIYDEGITVYGALRVMQGDLPYRDFWTVYMPGHYYLYAFIFKIFGVSLLAERVTSVVLMVAISVMSYVVVRRMLPASISLLVFFFTSVWLSTFDFFGYIIHPTLLFSLLSLYFFQRYLQSAHRTALIWTGIFAGMTALFRHDFGVYVFGAEMLLLSVRLLLLNKAEGLPWGRHMKKDLLKLAGGTVLVFLPAALYFVIQVPPQELYNSLFVFPLEIYAEYRQTPFPVLFERFGHYQQFVSEEMLADYVKSNLDHLYLYFPPIIYLVFALQLGIRLKKDKSFVKDPKSWMYFSVWLIGVFFFAKVLIRSVYLHVMPTYLVAIMVFFLAVFNIDSTLKHKKSNQFAYVLLLMLAIPALLRPLWSEFRNLAEDRLRVPLELPRAANISWDVRGAEYQQVIRYIEAHVPEDEKIFVGSIRHDRIFTNDVMMYFLSGRESATRYAELHPGIATTREVQQEIISDITSCGVRYIVLKDETRVEQANHSGISSGVTLLDDFIRSNFYLEKDFGHYSVWVKKPQVSGFVLN